MNKIFSLDELASFDKLTVHETPVGEVSFMVAANHPPLQKSYVSTHYRHTKDGKLVFVAGYSNKVQKKPEELTGGLWHKKPEELAHIHSKKIQEDKEYNQHYLAHPDNQFAVDEETGKKKKLPLKDVPEEKDLTDKFISFHYGDEVMVTYSHMHDQHYVVGAVVGTRDDPWHDGKLIAVRLIPSGETEYYAPSDLIHIHKQDAETRQHEASHHKDNKGNVIPYVHMSDSQRENFYDHYKVWFQLQRMGEQLGFLQNKQLFADPNTGEVPEHKLLKFSKKNKKTGETEIKNPKGMTIEQIHLLESLNKFRVIPFEGISQMVTQSGYDSGTHWAKMKTLLNDLKTVQEGIAQALNPSASPEELEQIVQKLPQGFPKVYTGKSKKNMPYVSPSLMGGMIPVSTTDQKMTEEEMNSLKMQVGEQTGFGSATPSTEGKMWGNSSDFYYGQPIVHGQVKEVKPEGTKYAPAPKVPPVATVATPMPAQAQPAGPKPETFVMTGGVPQKKKEAAPTPVVPMAPEAKPEPSVFAHKGKDISDLNFKFIDNAANKGYGGAHSKYILEANGEQYLFKPFNNEEGHRVWAEIIAAKLSEAVGVNAAIFGSKPIVVSIPAHGGGTYGGVTCTGSVQKIITGLKKKNIATYTQNWATCPKEVVEQLQREHVIDWLCGNHDAHAKQFVVDSEGKLVGIDKGQAFKFYGKDVLSTDYNPNYEYEGTQLYNQMMQAAQGGQLKLDFAVVQDFIKHLKSQMSVIKWTQMVKPFGEHSVKWADKVNKFMNLASDRYTGLEKDFKKLYQSAGVASDYDASTKQYKKTTPQPKTKLPESETYQPDAFMQIDAGFHAKVLHSGSHGHSILMGGGDIRNLDVTVTQYHWDDASKKTDSTKNTGLEISFEVMPHAEEKFLPFFDTVEDQVSESIVNTGHLPNDPLYGTVISTAKTVNNHCPNGGKNPDGAYNPSTLAVFAKWFQQPYSEYKSGEDIMFDTSKPIIGPEEIAMKLMDSHVTGKHYDDFATTAMEVAKHYHKIAEEIQTAVAGKQKTPTKAYGAWEGTYKQKKSAVSHNKHPLATHPFYVHDIETGKLIRKQGEKNTHYPYHNGSYNGPNSLAPFGTMFKKALPGNIEVRYYPHFSKDLSGDGHAEGGNNLRSQQGYFVLDFHHWDGNVDAMHQARQILKQVGIDHKLANHTDLEAMYLARVAWHNSADVSHKKEWQKIMKMENNDKKVEALKELCKASYGVRPDELKTYDPIPKWDSNYEGNATSGHHYWLNPYVLDHLAKKPSHVLLPLHNLTATKDVQSGKSIGMNGLLCTEMRLKFGLPPGTSSHEDQKTGGAISVYTKGSKQEYNPNKPMKEQGWLDKIGSGSLVFKPQLMARTDAYGYNGDNYGSTGDGTYSDGHYPISTRIPVMDMIQNKSHITEIMFRHRVALDTWLHGVKGKAQWITAMKDALKKKNPHLLSEIKIDPTGYNEDDYS